MTSERGICGAGSGRPLGFVGIDHNAERQRTQVGFLAACDHKAKMLMLQPGHRGGSFVVRSAVIAGAFQRGLNLRICSRTKRPARP